MVTNLKAVKNKRTINLGLRQGTVTNLNLQTEKHGDELVSRLDITLGFTVKDKEIDELINAKGNPLQLLWHKDKTVMFREISSFAVDLKAEGVLSIGISDEHMIEFPDAKLKKLVITPYVELQAGVKCQVRIDPTGNLEALDEMLLTGDVVMEFNGAEVEKDDTQQGLDV